MTSEETQKPANPVMTVHTEVDGNDNEIGKRYWWWCPGCDSLHVFDSRWPEPTGDIATAPTVEGSYLSRSNRWNPETKQHDIPFGEICHSYVRGGRIEYLSDCTHSLAGQTIDMVPLPDEWAY